MSSTAVVSNVEEDDAFQRIYEEWFHDVARWVLAFGARRADAEDLVQEVFLIVYRRLPSFDQRNVGGWLYRITRRRVRDYRRLSWIKSFFAASVVEPGDVALLATSGPLDELEGTEGRRLLERLLDTLPEEQRAAFVLFELEGIPGERIAALQQVAVGTVWARVHQARKKLLRQLNKRSR